jgi:hypothetical protein
MGGEWAGRCRSGRRGAGGGTCLPPQEDEAVAAAADVAGRSGAVPDEGGGHRTPLPQRPGRPRGVGDAAGEGTRATRAVAAHARPSGTWP